MASEVLWNRWQRSVSIFFPDLPSSSPTWASLVWQLPHLSWFSWPISSKEANVKPLPHILASITVAGSVCSHRRSGAPLNINERCGGEEAEGETRKTQKSLCCLNESNWSNISSGTGWVRWWAVMDLTSVWPLTRLIFLSTHRDSVPAWLGLPPEQSSPWVYLLLKIVPTTLLKMYLGTISHL